MEIDSFLDLVRRRRSVRRFKPDPVPDEYIEKILEAARFAMSGGHGQPWEFVVVKDKETKAKIADAVLQEEHRHYFMEQIRVEELRHPLASRPPVSRPAIADAPAIIVVCGDPRTFQASSVASRFMCSEGDSTFFMNLANATQLIHLAAAALGLGAQWDSVWRLEERELKDILGIPEIFRILVMVPIGFPAYQPGPLKRRELAEIVHHERYERSKYRTDEDVRKWLLEHRRRQREGRHFGQ